MADILSEKDVVLLYQAIAFGKASKLAQVIFTLENVMACIKRLLIDTVENKPSEVEVSYKLRKAVLFLLHFCTIDIESES